MMTASHAQLAYRYAHDIDFIQFGNEILGGPGEYYISDGSCTGGLGSLSQNCVQPAYDDVMEWMGEQIAVARMASALAGRPLRFITPATTRAEVLLGKDGDLTPPVDFDDPVDNNPNRAAYNVKRLIDFGNEHKAWIDLHLHYDFDGDLEDALYYFVNPNANTWEVPHFRTSLEWSPVPTQGWAENNNLAYRKYFWTTEGPPEFLWDVYVYDWGDNVLERPGGFPDLARDLTEIESYGLLHACYGEFGQGTISLHDVAPYFPKPDQFDLTVVRAESVIADDEWIADSTNLFTTIRSDLEEDNTAYLISSFTPHSAAPYDQCDCIPRP